jgi:ribosome maturation factor RimP
MTKKEMYEKRTEELLMPIIKENNFDLWDVEYVREGSNWYLRAYIDKEGGFTVNDCELVSRRLSDLLDKEDFIEDSYILEVSSPGLGRQLKKDRDFEKSIGKDVDVKLFTPVSGSKELTGSLKSFDKTSVVITFEDGIEQSIERKNISVIKLALDF